MPTLKLRPGVVVLTCAVLIASGSFSQFEGTRAAGSLFVEARVSGAAASAQRTLEPAVRRARYVTVDFNQLRAPGQRQMLREPALSLELFPDIALVAEFERYDAARDGMTWVGRVAGVPQSTVTLAYGGGMLVGTVAMPNGTFHIRPAAAAGDGVTLHEIQQVDQSAYLREAEPVEVRYSNAQLAAAADTPMTDTADTIDVMVLYTALAETHAGGPAGITNLINLGVSEANTSYANSGVLQRLRLVHAAKVSYAEPGSFSTSLNDLRIGAGALSGVAAMRDAFGADLVTMLVHPSGPSACGIGYLMSQVTPAFSTSGFSVTDTGCVSPNFTFAHELGHNMGARHDWYMDSSTTPFTYAHGYVNPTLGQRWRTVMAYPDMCTALGFSCTRVLYWANPERRYLPSCDSQRFNCGQLQYWYYPGAPMGIPSGTSTACQAGNSSNNACDADDSRVLNATALTIANFRQRVTDRVQPLR